MSELSVAIVGASNDRRKYGNKALRAYIESGYRVFPVNPNESHVEGVPAFASIDAIPEAIDYVSMYVPPAVGINLLPAIAAKKPKEVWLNPGSESDELIEAAADLHLRSVVACSFIAHGRSPGEFADA